MAKRPNVLDIKGYRYRLVIFQVLEEDEQGQPRLCKMLRDKDVVRVNGGEKFITAYVDEANLTT